MYCAHCGTVLRGVRPGTVPAGGGAARGPRVEAGTLDAGVGERGNPSTRVRTLSPYEHVFGKFRIEERLGEGGMGVVYRAYDEGLGSRVAVKVLHPRMAADPDATERLRWEVKVARSMQYDHVVPVFGYHEDDGVVGFDMKLLPGATLEDHLAGKVEASPFAGTPTAERLAWVTVLADQLAGALDYIHRRRRPDGSGSQQLVHRDVTPSNVMLAPLPRGAKPSDLHATLMDFGIAHAVGGSRFTVAGVAGRLGYIAPELQLAGVEPTPAADLWSFGLLLYQALTGKRPLVWLNMPAPSALVGGLPTAVDAAVLRCLNAPDTRPRSAGVVAAALASAVEGPRPPKPPNPPARPPKPPTPPVEEPWDQAEKDRKAREEAERKAQALRDRFGMVRIEPGTFRMGSEVDEEGRREDEALHEVRISRAFELGRTPVTQALWSAVMAANPSRFVGEEHPVETVSWMDAVRFCNVLSRKAGLGLAYQASGAQVTWDREAEGFRLPTEAEWEYAARAGGRHRFAGSDSHSAVAVSERVLRTDAGVFKKPKTRFLGTMPVASREPNAWDLYDLSGNVWEWCWDWYDPSPEGPVTDPVGPEIGQARVARGGSWKAEDPRFLRVAVRDSYDPAFRYTGVGLRLARSPV